MGSSRKGEVNHFRSWEAENIWRREENPGELSALMVGGTGHKDPEPTEEGALRSQEKSPRESCFRGKADRMTSRPFGKVEHS